MSMSVLSLQNISNTDVSLREEKQNSILYNNLKETREDGSKQKFVVKNRYGLKGQLLTIP